MKIKTTDLSYKEALKRIEKKHRPPQFPALPMRFLMQTLSAGELKDTDFTYNTFGMEKLGPLEPCLILMNHSSFIDLKIVSKIFKKRPYNIVCTSDGFVGKENLMYSLGCIPTQKFTSDVTLVKDMMFTLKTLKSSVLMYPEASYSFDGTATPLPSSVGKCIKILGCPVVMIRTHGAFLRDPLYNNLQVRDVKVSADVTYVFSPEDTKTLSAKEIQDKLNELFTFDNFKEQLETGTLVKEDFRADYLNRVCFKCCECHKEGAMVGKGTTLTCMACGSKWTMNEDGTLTKQNGETRFKHIPDWYAWEREEVRQEIIDDRYELDIPVDIRVLTDKKSIYNVGTGRLVHNKDGFKLTGCEGELEYTQGPKATYSLYSDYFWYELGDMICIGNHDILYYCFPKEPGDFVAKTRLATEEIYKLAEE